MEESYPINTIYTIRAILQQKKRNDIASGVIEISAHPTNLNIIQVYALTSECKEEEIEHFYEELNNALKTTKKEVIIIMGDFNTQVGKGAAKSIIGEYGLGTRNDRGDRLIKFCQGTDNAIMNTQFKLPNRRLYTWRTPVDSPQRIAKDQINYILINKRYRNAITSTKTYPGPEYALWKECMEELFSEQNYQVEIYEQAESVPDITRKEVTTTINRLKHNKLPGLDEIHAEV
ncbi:hypothetical protein ILUMI_25394 [Ignelater luminosus]|uniref:Craniofacial development protein 2-like n=1 Tax=Ignelater luminosus TaxID=2038154 RepID=A0A8K0C8L3_IGNLU|nr:hypothetical protein ILUMI_25394 [Ignelater luminosus]